MQLSTNGTSILAGPRAVRIATIDPRRAQAALLAQGYRPDVAREVAWGELSSEAAQRLGHMSGLIAKE